MPPIRNAHSLNDLRECLKTRVFAAYIPFPDRRAILSVRFVRFIQFGWIRLFSALPAPVPLYFERVVFRR